MEAEITFEKEKINGIAVVGSYLIDAAHRLGVYIAEESGRLGLDDSTSVTVKSGAEFLSLPTKAELEVLSPERRGQGERLACQAKIAKKGAIVIETKDKPEVEIDKDEEYKKEFAELPLEKKVAKLVDLEAMTLSETFSFVLNSPQKIVGKIMDVMAEFGLKLEDETKKAAKPEEHREDNAENDETKTAKKKSKPVKPSVADQPED